MDITDSSGDTAQRVAEMYDQKGCVDLIRDHLERKLKEMEEEEEREREGEGSFPSSPRSSLDTTKLSNRRSPTASKKPKGSSSPVTWSRGSPSGRKGSSPGTSTSSKGSHEGSSGKKGSSPGTVSKGSHEGSSGKKGSSPGTVSKGSHDYHRTANHDVNVSAKKQKHH